MNMRDLIPSGRNRNLPATSLSDNANPFLALHREMNRIFDDFARGFDLPAASNGWSAGWPHVEVSETDEELRVVAELPGLGERDIEVTLHDGMLTLKGEKKSESQGAVYGERWHGRFEFDAARSRCRSRQGYRGIQEPCSNDHCGLEAGGPTASKAHRDQRGMICR